MSKKSIKEVLRNAMYKVKTGMESEENIQLDVGVIYKYTQAYRKLHQTLKKNEVIKSEYDGIYNNATLWEANLRDAFDRSKKYILMPFKTASIIEMITNMEALIYVAKDAIEDKKMDAAVRKEILVPFNEVLHLLMTTNGGIPKEVKEN